MIEFSRERVVARRLSMTGERARWLTNNGGSIPTSAASSG
jgi:hypothetical protein